MAVTKRPLFDPPHRAARARATAFVQAAPAPHGPEPGHVRGAGRQRAHDRRAGARRRRTGDADIGLHPAARPLALVHGALRQLRRGDGRRPGQGAGRHAAASAPGHARPSGSAIPSTAATVEMVPATDAPRGDLVALHARRHHPGRRRGRRGRRVGGRVGDHRRVGAGHPRVGRRPLGRHRRHQGAVRLPRHPDHRQPGRDLHRPDDRAGRGRRAAEDAERDRAHDPALRAHDDLPARRRHAPAVRDLQRRRGRRSRSSSRCSSASSRPPSAACSRPSASRAWTGSSSRT